MKEMSPEVGWVSGKKGTPVRKSTQQIVAEVWN
jgi:hypothetical protein